MSHTKLPRIRKSLTQEGTARAIRAVRGAVIGILIARHLGPENFGLYSFAISIVSIAAIALPMGTDQVLMKLLSQKDSDEKSLVATSIRIRLCGLGLSLLAVTVFLLIRPQSWTVNYIIAALCAGELAKVLMAKSLALQARHEFRVIAKSDIIAVSTGAVIALLGIILDWPIWTFALALSMDAWVLAILLWLLPKKETGKAKTKSPRMSQLMKQGVPFLLSSAAVILYMKIDLVMLEQIRGSRDAGLYAASVRACEVGLLAPITFISVMTPRLYAASSDQIRDVFTLATIWMSRICAATMLLGLVLGVPLFPILYSDGFKEAVPVFACLLPSIIFLGIGLLTRTLMVKSSRHWALTIGHGSAAVLNIGLNFLLIPDYGMYGAAIATIASYACATFIPVCLVSENRWAINVIVRSFRLF